jgi:diadenosine tetraphosphate (Ap4A) HIT family hydrolase
MARTRIPFDVSRLTRKVTNCFICDFLNGNPRYKHHIVAETETAIAFLNRFPTLFGYVLVAPKRHYEQVTGDVEEEEYVEMQRFIYKVSETMRQLLEPERIYILSLGSQAANSHVHWHVAPLPEGVPLEQQQYHALMHENGVIEATEDELAGFAERFRNAMGQLDN